MSLSRFTIRTLLAVGGFALLLSCVSAQQDLPSRPAAESSRIKALRGVRGGIPEDKLKTTRDDFQKLAEYFAAIVEHPVTWKASQDLKASIPGEGRMSLEGPNGVFHELDVYLQEATPGSAKVGQDQAAYIREFGAALDGTFRKLIEGNGERIVRVNAARVYAHFARTGAPAHFPSLTAMLADPKIPPEVKYHLYHAAAALLAASDVAEPKLRKHAADPPVVGALAQVLMEHVTDASKLLPGFKPDKATEDELAVAGLLRRQAVRALGQVKFVRLPTPDGKGDIYPSYTLVRVALGDPALKPAPGPAEAAEAAIGILNMAPVEWKTNRFEPVREYNPAVALEAVTEALLTFATPRASDRADRSLPWRNYSLRLAEALARWKPLFDPLLDAGQYAKFDPAQVAAVQAANFPARFDGVYKDVVPKVLARIEKVDSAGMPSVDAVEIDVLRRHLKAMRDDPKRPTKLFDNVEKTSILFSKKE